MARAALSFRYLDHNSESALIVLIKVRFAFKLFFLPFALLRLDRRVPLLGTAAVLRKGDGLWLSIFTSPINSRLKRLWTTENYVSYFDLKWSFFRAGQSHLQLMMTKHQNSNLGLPSSLAPCLSARIPLTMTPPLQNPSRTLPLPPNQYRPER